MSELTKEERDWLEKYGSSMHDVGACIDWIIKFRRELIEKEKKENFLAEELGKTDTEIERLKKELAAKDKEIEELKQKIRSIPVFGEIIAKDFDSPQPPQV